MPSTIQLARGNPTHPSRISNFYVHNEAFHNSPKWTKILPLWGQSTPIYSYTLSHVFCLHTSHSLNYQFKDLNHDLFLLVYTLCLSQCLSMLICSINVWWTDIKTVIDNILAKIKFPCIRTCSCSELRKAVWLYRYNGYLMCSQF